MYSLTFAMSNDLTTEKNTWTDWGLIPDSPPMINPPEPDTKFVDIPGRKRGPIDVTTMLIGDVCYKRTSGSWNFYREIGSVNTRRIVYNAILSFLHGRKGKVMLEEDPDHYYWGRFTVTLPKSIKNPMSISINYDLEPVRYNVSDDSIDTTYPS